MRPPATGDYADQPLTGTRRAALLGTCARARATRRHAPSEEGLTALAEALAQVDKTGERYYEAELYRIKGELTLQKFPVASSQSSVTNPQSPTPNPQTEAEACFHKAVEIAQQQQARSLELRAVMSLVRLRQRQVALSESRNTDHGLRTKLNEAHRMLSEIYNWFTEGFDTKDLQEAKALLESLSR